MAATFFTWQNLNRRYPPPFAHFEQANYRRARLAIAGSADAATVLRAKGYAGEIAVIPQFGVDEGIFQRRGAENAAGKQGRSLQSGESAPIGVHPRPAFRVGYAGGLVQEKGVDLLIRACAALGVEWELLLAGEGAEDAALAALAAELRVATRVKFAGKYVSNQMPDFYNQIDVLVLPSRTQANWKEQFGRVLVEAMACEVPVVGSNSGEIPHVIGDAGLIFPEGEVEALAGHLNRLANDPNLRRRFGARGRQRVLAHYTMGRVAEETVAAYSNVLG
jgi:glycosyltransferase involved in cell wall biosynthesis